jgi:hypothetical protein
VAWSPGESNAATAAPEGGFCGLAEGFTIRGGERAAAITATASVAEFCWANFGSYKKRNRLAGFLRYPS